jgi:tetrahydromethanopterin S-methyltransferase subunit F
LRVVQTGRVQGYLIAGMAFAVLLLSYLALTRP